MSDRITAGSPTEAGLSSGPRRSVRVRRLARLVALLLAVAAWASASLLDWSRPVTLLLLGSDSRAPSGLARSDSIFVLHIDPQHHLMRGLSLPRDLYVPLSGLPVLRTERINSALYFGDYYSGGQGIEAARQTVSDQLGVPIDGVVVVRFDFIKRLIDALGGVEVYCEKPLSDKAFIAMEGGRTYPIRFEAGWNFLTGSRALEFIRLRRPDTDFGRMGRNRQLASAIEKRLTSLGALARLPLLLPAARTGVSTDIGPAGFLRIAAAWRRCGGADIEWATLEKEDAQPHKTPRGAQVLLAEPDVLRDAGKVLVGEQPLRLAGTPDSTIQWQ